MDWLGLRENSQYGSTENAVENWRIKVGVMLCYSPNYLHFSESVHKAAVVLIEVQVSLQVGEK